MRSFESVIAQPTLRFLPDDPSHVYLDQSGMRLWATSTVCFAIELAFLEATTPWGRTTTVGALAHSNTVARDRLRGQYARGWFVRNWSGRWSFKGPQ